MPIFPVATCVSRTGEMIASTSRLLYGIAGTKLSVRAISEGFGRRLR